MPLPDIDLIRLPTNWLQGRMGFITGATGWIGSWICQALERSGLPFLMIRHTDEQNILNFRFPDTCDYIIHLAPGRVERVIECADRFSCPVVFASSGAVYMTKPDEYAMAKQDAEREFVQSGVDVRIARIFTTAGAGIPMGRGLALAEFICSAMSGQPLHVWSNGEAIRSYLYISDLVTWLFKILAFGENKAYDIGSEDEISIMELARMVRAFVKPHPKIIVDAGPIKERLPYYIPDTSEAQALGCRVTVSTEEAIEKTVRWYELQGM